MALGFKGPIYCSQATAVLLPLMLEDAVKIGLTRVRRLVQQGLPLRGAEVQSEALLVFEI